MTDKQSKQEAN